MKKMILLAAVAAVICGVLVFGYLRILELRTEAAERASVPKTESVVVAAQDIPPFTDITKEMITFRAFPAEYIPAAAARKVDDVIGLQADGTIVAGEILYTTALAEAEEIGSSLSIRIPDGMRAMTVSVSTDTGVGGYLTEGDFVDVLQYIPTEDPDSITADNGETREISGGVTKVILEGVEILELGTKRSDAEMSVLYSNVTLALTPEQCSMLVASQSMEGGELYLSLRQRDNDSKEYSATVTYTEQAG